MQMERQTDRQTDRQTGTTSPFCVDFMHYYKEHIKIVKAHNICKLSFKV